MDIDIEFLKRTANARQDVGNWLKNRPKVGLDVLTLRCWLMALITW